MEILDYINSEPVKPDVKEYSDLINTATGHVITKTPLSEKWSWSAGQRNGAGGFR